MAVAMGRGAGKSGSLASLRQAQSSLLGPEIPGCFQAIETLLPIPHPLMRPLPPSQEKYHPWERQDACSSHCHPPTLLHHSGEGGAALPCAWRICGGQDTDAHGLDTKIPFHISGGGWGLSILRGMASGGNWLSLCIFSVPSPVSDS